MGTNYYLLLENVFRQTMLPPLEMMDGCLDQFKCKFWPYPSMMDLTVDTEYILDKMKLSQMWILGCLLEKGKTCGRIQTENEVYYHNFLF